MTDSVWDLVSNSLFSSKNYFTELYLDFLQLTFSQKFLKQGYNYARV